MDKYLEIKKRFESREDKENAIAMSKYMRNLFDFFGLPTPKRKEIYKDLIRSEKKAKQQVSFEDIPKIRNYITTKSWWDTIDFLCRVIGDIGLRDSRVKELMIDWSKSENIWLRRTAIEHQLGLKDKTDTELLECIIVNSFGSNEFFVNKAIGWALRDYSKTDPEFVKGFIDKYKDKMSRLSIKEASKYI